MPGFVKTGLIAAALLGISGARPAAEVLDADVRGQLIKAPDGLLRHIETEYNDIYITKQQEFLTMSFQRYRRTYTESTINLTDAGDLPVLYTRAMTIGLAYPGKVRRMLMIGLGGGAISTYLGRYIPDLAIDIVEIDPGVIAAARRYFGIRETELVRLIESDGRVFLNRNKQLYDLIAVDAFRGGYVPFHLLTREFYLLLKQRLEPGGAAIFNVRDGTRLYLSTVKTLDAVFPSVDLYRVGGGSVIAVTTREPRPGMDILLSRATALQKQYGFRYSLVELLSERHDKPETADANLLTDDFSPAAVYDAILQHNKRRW